MNPSRVSTERRGADFGRFIVLSAALLAFAGCAGGEPEEVVDETAAAVSEAENAAIAPAESSATPATAAVQSSPAASVETGASPEVQPEAPPAAVVQPPGVPAPSLDPSPPSEADLLAAAPPDTSTPLPPATVIVPEGSRISVLLIDSISSAENLAGDQFLASLAEPIRAGDQIVVESGVTLRGQVVEVQESGRVQGRARIQLVLTHILSDGDPVPISTRPFAQEAETDLGRDATLGGIGAAAGAAIGAIAGGGKGAAIGAVAGGAGTVAATRGRNLEYPSETRLDFELSRAVELERVGAPERAGERLGQ